MKISHNYLGRYPFILNERVTNISANIEQAYKYQEMKKLEVSVGVLFIGSDLISDICQEFEGNPRNVTGSAPAPPPSTTEKQDQDYLR